MHVNSMLPLNTTLPHPAAKELGITVDLPAGATLSYYALGMESEYQVLKVSVDLHGELTFRLFAKDREVGASYNPNGTLVQLRCTTGIPKGSLEDVAKMFCAEAILALEYMTLGQ